jgi:hypothetical protein
MKNKTRTWLTYSLNSLVVYCGVIANKSHLTYRQLTDGVAGANKTLLFFGWLTEGGIALCVAKLP